MTWIAQQSGEIKLTMIITISFKFIIFILQKNVISIIYLFNDYLY